MQDAWNSATPGAPLKYSCADKDVNNYYGAEQKWSGIAG
jgi:hypothetical protein